MVASPEIADSGWRSQSDHHTHTVAARCPTAFCRLTLPRIDQSDGGSRPRNAYHHPALQLIQGLSELRSHGCVPQGFLTCYGLLRQGLPCWFLVSTSLTLFTLTCSGACSSMMDFLLYVLLPLCVPFLSLASRNALCYARGAMAASGALELLFASIGHVVPCNSHSNREPRSNSIS